MNRSFSVVTLGALAALCLVPVPAALGRIPPEREKFGILNREKADVVAIGNSMQQKGIDFRELSKQVGRKVSSYTFGGAMTVYQYSIQKYMIPKLDKKPKIVMIIERKNHFTCPQKRSNEYWSRSRGMPNP